MATNFLSLRSSAAPSISAVNLTISTLTGSVITGSTLSASTMTGNQITISTLTVSSINNGTPGVAAYSTFNASSINVSSTITTTTLATSILTVSAQTELGNRLLGLVDGSNVFWLGLRGSGTEADRLAISLVGDATTGAVSQITLQKPVVVAGNITKLGTTVGNDLRVEGGTATNSGFINFVQGNISRGYIGNANATDMFIAAQNGAQLSVDVGGTRRLSIDTSGNIIQAGGIFYKNSATANSYMTMNGGDANNSPFMEFYYGGLRRCYIGNANASSFELYCQNNADLNIWTGGLLRMKVDNAGITTISSKELRVSNLSSAANGQLRLTNGTAGHGMMLYNDGSGFFFLITNNNDVNGSYNSLRPLYITEGTGRVSMDNGVNIQGGLNVGSGNLICGNQPFVIVGGVAGANIAFTAGTNFGSSGNLFAYTSAGYSNTSGSGWESATGRFWATLLGRYQVNFTFFWNSFTAGSRAVMRHFNSAGTFLEDRYCATSSVGHGADTLQTYSTIVYMSAGSRLEFQFQSGGGTLFFGGIMHTHCSFHYIC